MPIGAEPRAVTLFLETLHLLRDELGVNTTCGAGNTSLRPARPAHARRRVPRRRAEPRPDERDHGLAPAEMVEAVRATDFLLGRDEWGATWIRMYRAKQAAATRVSALEDSRRTAASRPGPPALPPGPARTAPSRRRACSPARRSSTPRAGTASRSTRPAAATAPARSARSRSSPGTRRSAAVDPRAFSIEELKNGWRLACRADDAGGPDDRGAAAADAAEGRARRRRAPRDPAAGRAEALRRARRADARGSDVRSRAPARGDGRRRAARAARRSCATLGGTLRRADWKVTAVLADDLLIDVEPGDTSGSRHAIAFDLGTTTVVATLLDLETGPAEGGAVDPERAAAVRRRRDLADLGDHDGRRRARRCCSGTRTRRCSS